MVLMSSRPIFNDVRFGAGVLDFSGLTCHMACQSISIGRKLMVISVICPRTIQIANEIAVPNNEIKNPASKKCSRKIKDATATAPGRNIAMYVYIAIFCWKRLR